MANICYVGCQMLCLTEKDIGNERWGQEYNEDEEATAGFVMKQLVTVLIGGDFNIFPQCFA